MEEHKRLEFYYGRLLRESTMEHRKELYKEAYSKVSECALERFTCNDPEKRTAGTSQEIVQLIRQNVDKNDSILEIGCGRGYTCLKLAPFVKEIIGIDVSDSSVAEATNVLNMNNIENAEIRKLSAMELDNQFQRAQFDVCISIDVYEHLHPEDGIQHIEQVFKVLRAGGKYIAFIPNRLNGPHDITKTELPEATEAMGFHLNETTYSELSEVFKEIGFRKIGALYRMRIFNFLVAVKLHYRISTFIEALYNRIQITVLKKILNRFLFIRIIAQK